MYSSNDRARRALAAAPWLAYPLVVWAGLSLGGPRVAASLVLVALAARTLPLWRSSAAAARGHTALATLDREGALLFETPPEIVQRIRG